MKLKSFIGGFAVGALLVSCIPYKVEKDKETGALEVRSFLWALKKIPKKDGEENDHFFFAMPPAGLDLQMAAVETKEPEEQDEFEEE